MAVNSGSPQQQQVGELTKWNKLYTYISSTLCLYLLITLKGRVAKREWEGMGESERGMWGNCESARRENYVYFVFQVFMELPIIEGPHNTSKQNSTWTHGRLRKEWGEKKNNLRGGYPNVLPIALQLIFFKAKIPCWLGHKHYERAMKSCEKVCSLSLSLPLCLCLSLSFSIALIIILSLWRTIFSEHESEMRALEIWVIICVLPYFLR